MGTKLLKVARWVLLPSLGMQVLIVGVAAAEGNMPAADAPVTHAPRSYQMGFSFTAPPLRTLPEYFKRFDVWVQRADAAITHHDMPWKALLAGTPPETIVREDLLKQIEFLRQRQLLIIITLEPVNGLDRVRRKRRS